MQFNRYSYAFFCREDTCIQYETRITIFFYEKLLLVYVWGLDVSSSLVVYIFTYI